MKKIKLGVIGTGLVFKHFHLPVLQNMQDCFEIIALCNRTETKAEKIAKEIPGSPKIFKRHLDLLKDTNIDTVLVTVPIYKTNEIVIDSLNHGKNVIQEKPISDDIGSAEVSIKLAKERKLRLMVGENFRYKPEFSQINSLMKEGLIGNPKIYRLNDLHYTYPGGIWSQTNWRKEGKHKGGYLLDGGSHIIAGMRETVKSEVKTVHGLTSSFNPSLLSNQSDALLLHLVFENGMIGEMALGYGAVDREARLPKVYGDKGTLVLRASKKIIEFWPIDKDAEPTAISVTETDDDFTLQWKDFYQSLCNRTAPYSTAEDALIDLRILFAGIDSANSGKVVKLR